MRTLASVVVTVLVTVLVITLLGPAASGAAPPTTGRQATCQRTLPSYPEIKRGTTSKAVRSLQCVLNDAGLLAGRRYTAHHSVAHELTAILADQRVVADGQILTSRGAGTALDFGLFLVEKLFSREKAKEIAQSVCA